MEREGPPTPMYFRHGQIRLDGAWPCIQQLNEGRVSMPGAMHIEAVAAAKIRPSVIGFADEVLRFGSDSTGVRIDVRCGGVGDLLLWEVLTPVVSPIEFANVVDSSSEAFDDDRTLIAVCNVADFAGSR